jgi:hypothetical protein
LKRVRVRVVGAGAEAGAAEIDAAHGERRS